MFIFVLKLFSNLMQTQVFRAKFVILSRSGATHGCRICCTRHIELRAILHAGLVEINRRQASHEITPEVAHGQRSVLRIALEDHFVCQRCFSHRIITLPRSHELFAWVCMSFFFFPLPKIKRLKLYIFLTFRRKV